MESAYFLERQASKCFGIKAKYEKPTPKEIPKMSAKRKVDNKEYKKKIKAQVLKDDRCKIKSPVCTGKMQGFDHKQKRSPANLLNDKNLLPACNACNLYKEENPVWARNNGFSISRFKKIA